MNHPICPRFAKLVVLVALPAVCLPQAGAPPGKPVRVGFICPFTGGSQDFGNSAHLGAELAAKEMNDFDLGVKSLAAEVQAARAAGADVIVGYTVGPEFATLAAARTEAKFAGPLSLRTVLDKAGASAEGAIVVQTISEIQFQYPEDAKRASVIRRKQPG